MTQLAEAQLVDAVQHGDSGALGQLLETHQHRIYNVCLRMVSNRDDAAEVAQDAMLKIIEHIGDFKGQSAISTWMIRIAMNLSLSHLRKRRVRKTVSLDADNGRFGGDPGGDGDQSTALRHRMADQREPGPEQRVQQDEMIGLLHLALGRLDDDFRAVLVLRDIEQLNYHRIAEVLAIPAGTVKSRLFRARLALREQMMKLCPDQDKRQQAPDTIYQPRTTNP